MVIEPMDPADALSEEDQRAEGAEDEEIIKYSQELRLFNSSDYFGKSKGLTMSYDKNMRIKFYKAPAGSDQPVEELELLDTFELSDLKEQFAMELKAAEERIEREKEKAKKKAEKKKNETENSTDEDKKDDKKDAEEIDSTSDKLEKPKLKLSVLLSRSGYIQLKTAQIGVMPLSTSPLRKSSQLSSDQIQQAKKRLKWYSKRDEDKIKTDIARNDFESMIYKMREWLREDDNADFVEESVREERIEKLAEMEDWLYEDGADANYTVY